MADDLGRRIRRSSERVRRVGELRIRRLWNVREVDLLRAYAARSLRLDARALMIRIASPCADLLVAYTLRSRRSMARKSSTGSGIAVVG
jgi:hypothetical protein